LPESTYKIIELVGSSENGWEEAVNMAVTKAAESVRDIRICEVLQLDTRIADNKIVAYRARVKISFKYETVE
jgi:flavin-binding protein dodecin